MTVSRSFCLITMRKTSAITMPAHKTADMCPVRHAADGLFRSHNRPVAVDKLKNDPEPDGDDGRHRDDKVQQNSAHPVARE